MSQSTSLSHTNPHKAVGLRLNILLVENSPLDAELARAALVDGGIEPTITRVESREQFLAAITDARIDLILSDFILPGLSGTGALELARQHRPDVPFIFVSGELGEETAIESLKMGATDYVLKQRLQRLVPAVLRAIEERNERVQRRRAEDLLSQSEERFRMLVEEVKDYAIFVLDLHGRITSWNSGARRILGYREDEALHQSAAIFFTPEDRANNVLEQELAHAAAEGRSTDDRWHLRKDGSRLFASGVTTALHDRSGKLIGFAKMMRDMTERQQVDEERARLLESEQAARKFAEVANRAKDEFLATLSHELRTPLNAILGWAVMLRTGQMNPEDLNEGLEVIERNAKAQAQLIEDLLDISRIISGKIRLDVRPTNLRDVVQAAVAAVQLAADAKEIRINVVCPDDAASTTVSGDTNRLQQVIWNLLSNAMKFTPRGGRIDVTLERDDGMLRLSVRDSGSGIAPEFLPYVFDRFRQADGTTRRTHGGLGLGLAIVRHLVELHGGSVRADSDGLEKGATFTVALPAPVRGRSAPASPPAIAAPATPATIADDAHPSSAAGAVAASSKAGGNDDAACGGSSLAPLAKTLTGLNVLVVDDEPDARRLMRAVLEECGATVSEAASVAAASEILKSNLPDVVVSDIGMPNEDGYSLARHLRDLEARQDHPRTPALALTAFASRDDGRRALAAGFDRHAAKPITPHELVAVVRELVGRVAA